MKLYRTRTQEEFDWLAEQANDKGYVFYERSVWEDYKENTVVYYLKDDKSYVSHEPVDLVRKQYPEEDYPIIEVSDLMGTVDHDTLMQKVLERNNKPKPYTPPNTGDPWIDNLPESYFEMYEEESFKELTESLDLIGHHKRICERLNKVYADKNHDYGNSFGETYEKYGDISALVRISDKMNRIEQLVQTGEQKVKDEALEDSILDMANYLIMWAMELEETE